MKAKAAIAALAVLLVTAPLSAVDLSLDAGLSANLVEGRPFSLDLGEHLQLGQTLSGPFYAKLELSHGTSLVASGGLDYLPVESRALATVEYLADIGLAGLTLGMNGKGLGLGRDLALFELGAFASGSIPLVGDLLVVDLGLRGFTDFAGALGRLEVAPVLYLPLASPMSIGLRAELSATAGNYAGKTYTGISSLEIGPKILLSLARPFSLDLRAGAVIDLSGGAFTSTPSRFYAGAVMGVALESGSE